MTLRYYIPLIKAVPRRIQKPGSRGGKFYFDGRGVLHYGQRPLAAHRVVAPGDLFDHQKHLHNLIKFGSGKHQSVDDLARQLKLHPEAAANVLAHLHQKHDGAVDVRTNSKGRVRGVRINRTPATGVAEDSLDYTRDFSNAVRSFPSKFSAFAKDKLFERGDSLLTKDSEDGVFRYEIARAGTLSRALVPGKNFHVTYGMELSNYENGELLLEGLHKEGLSCPYQTIPVAVVQRTDPGDEHSQGSTISELKGESGKKVFVRRWMECVIDFFLRDKKHAEKVIDYINEKTAKRGDDHRDVLPGSQDVPNIRTNVKISGDGQTTGFVNVMELEGKQELIIVGRVDLSEQGFDVSTLYIDSFSGFSKSLFLVYSDLDTGQLAQLTLHSEDVCNGTVPIR